MNIPPRQNIQKIFDTYENKCAFHTCQKIIIDSEDDVNGNIIFIESNKKDHPRYNPKLTDEQMTAYTNLIMFCDVHMYEIKWKKDEYTASGLRKKLYEDMKTFPKNGYKLSDEIYELFLHHFIDYHDPDSFSQTEVLASGYDKGADGDWYFSHFVYSNSVIKPTKHFVGGFFKLIDYKSRIRENDLVLFYPKDSTSNSGVQAKTEFKSKMRLFGTVPNLKKGEYFVSLHSSLDEKSKLDPDLSFTVLENS